MRNEKIFVVGCTGQVALPVACALAAQNEVLGLARFRNREAREQLEAAGVQCAMLDMRDPELSAIPDDCTVVLDFAVSRTGRWQPDLDANVVGLGFLMEHCRRARAFLHCSTSGVYQPQTDHVFVEGDALGDNHRPWEPSMSVPIYLQHLEDRVRGDGRIREPAIRSADDHHPSGRPLWRQRRMAGVPPGANGRRDSDRGAPGASQPVQPDTRDRHSSDDSRAC